MIFSLLLDGLSRKCFISLLLREKVVFTSSELGFSNSQLPDRTWALLKVDGIVWIELNLRSLVQNCGIDNSLVIRAFVIVISPSPCRSFRILLKSVTISITPPVAPPGSLLFSYSRRYPIWRSSLGRRIIMNLISNRTLMTLNNIGRIVSMQALAWRVIIEILAELLVCSDAWVLLVNKFICLFVQI